MILTLILGFIGAFVILGLAAILASGNGEDVVICEDCREACKLIGQNIGPDGLGVSIYKCPKCGKVYKLN